MAGTIRLIVALMLALLLGATTVVAGPWGYRPAGCAPANTEHFYLLVSAPVHAPSSFPAYPMPASRALAQPTPAPPSGSAEPPASPRRAPIVIESRSLSGADAAQAVDVALGRCKVGFWNITGEDVALTIDGQLRTLPKNRAVTLELARTFVWQLADRAPKTERVPDHQNAYEVILRP